MNKGLRNDSGTSTACIQDGIGILIQTHYQKPISFSIPLAKGK